MTRTGCGRVGLPLIAILLLSVVACTVPAPPPPIVRAAAGDVQGIDSGTVHRYLGIRYARPPVGPLRWAPPEPEPRAQGTLVADRPGASCPQYRTAGDAAGEQGEDCLFLDVTTPPDAVAGSHLPVIVWWHGGGFLTGAGAEYDPSRLVAQGHVIVVTVNYRLGLLGSLGLPGLPDSGAFGFADQLQSLRWTRDNIAAFGGDPDDVTVAGQSAGGIAACALLASPALATYEIARVGIMSGACSVSPPTGAVIARSGPLDVFHPVEDFAAAGQRTAAALGCDGPAPLECLRSKPVDALLEAQGSGQFGSVDGFLGMAYGNDLLPVDPVTALGDRGRPAVPVIIGGTRDEARSFVAPAQRTRPEAFTAATYPQLLAQGFGPSVGAVEAQYPVNAYGGSAALAWSTVLTDSGWSCPTLADERRLAARTPTYAYEFDQPDEDVAGGVLPLGANHSSDLMLLFDAFGRPPPQQQRKALSDLVIAYWSSFAADGHPRAAEGPAWEPLSAEAPRPLRLSVTGVQETDTGAEHQCAFWAALS